MKVYKNNIDFDDAYLNRNGQYKVYGLSQDIKKGNIIYLDLCIFKDAHTYIRGRVVKRFKYVTIINYEYI